ncbi:MAG: large conductance mechanosensitive channel protein MscL [Myxococcota bacterium]
MLKGFKDFLLRGNVVDLAVAVIIGTAFGAIVKSVVEDLITPLIGLIFGKPDFSSITLGPVKFGNFLNAAVGFLLVATAVYFMIVLPMKKLQERLKKAEPAPAPAAPPEPSEEVKLLREIRDSLKKS